MNIVNKTKDLVINFLVKADNFIDITTECSKELSKFALNGYNLVLASTICISCILGMLVYASIMIPWVFGLWVWEKVK